MLDVWWAIERAIYPRDPDARLAFQKDLREALILPDGSRTGAYTGLVEFSQPAAADAPGDQMQGAIGQLRVEMLLNINT
jgi:hypothetical protein